RDGFVHRHTHKSSDINYFSGILACGKSADPCRTWSATKDRTSVAATTVAATTVATPIAATTVSAAGITPLVDPSVPGPAAIAAPEAACFWLANRRDGARARTVQRTQCRVVAGQRRFDDLAELELAQESRIYERQLRRRQRNMPED